MDSHGGSSQGVAPDHGRSLRVLIAEDNAVNRLMLKYALERFHCSVVAVANGLQAVEAVRGGGFDLAILDYQMPLLDGLGATSEIRRLEQTSHRARMPVIACTASAMKHECEACLQAGMDAVLTKPFRLDELQALLLKWGGAAS